MKNEIREVGSDATCESLSHRKIRGNLSVKSMEFELQEQDTHQTDNLNSGGCICRVSREEEEEQEKN